METAGVFGKCLIVIALPISNSLSELNEFNMLLSMCHSCDCVAVRELKE